MQILSSKQLMIVIVLILGVLWPSDAVTGNEGEAAFVDLDGDGFDDRTVDVDDNGIPDEYESSRNTGSDVFNANFAEFATKLRIGQPLMMPSSASGCFALRQFRVRDLSWSRSNSESDFGSGLGLGLGISLGGSACAGGLCVPGGRP